MNFLDAVILIPVLWFAYKGFTKGLVIELASLISLMLGIYGGLKFSDWASAYLARWFTIKSAYLPLVSFAVVFLGIVLAVYFLSRLIDRLVKSASLGLVNRILGAVFATLKIMLIFGVIIMMINKFDKNGAVLGPALRNQSLLYNPLSKTVECIYPSVSELFKTVIE